MKINERLDAFLTEVEAEVFEHARHPIDGIMWHPERDSPATSVDHQLLTALFETRSQ